MCKQEAREEWRDRGSKAEWKLKERERERPLEDQLLTILTNSQIWRNAAGMAILETPVAMMENNQAKIPLHMGKWKGKNTRTGRENVSWLLTSPYFRGFLWMRVLKIPSWQCAHVCWMERIKEKVEVAGCLLCPLPFNHSTPVDPCRQWAAADYSQRILLYQPPDWKVLYILFNLLDYNCWNWHKLQHLLPAQKISWFTGKKRAGNPNMSEKHWDSNQCRKILIPQRAFSLFFVQAFFIPFLSS